MTMYQLLMPQITCLNLFLPCTVIVRLMKLSLPLLSRWFDSVNESKRG